jgi:comEA protein
MEVTGLIWAIAVAAFEPLSESPWLSGGAAAALFPRTHLSIPLNPSSVGLLEETTLAIAASRPFGFRELDRTAVAAGSAGQRLAWGGFASYSGRNGYSEITASAAGAFTMFRGAVGGISCSLHRLSIENYGNTTEFSTDIGITARPVEGLFLGGSCRGLVSSSPTAAGEGTVPRTVSAAAGICPVTGVTLAASISMHQYSGKELSFVTSVEPFPGINLSASLLTPPVRMGFSVLLSVSSASFQYGYTTHTDLPSGHSVCLCYGGSGFKPQPLSLSEEGSAAGVAVFPIDVNAATLEELTQIPGIGPSKASAILNYIENNGQFRSIDEMVQVPGIGPATLERIRSYLRV